VIGNRPRRGAATADAARRRGADPLQLARRIAAALHAPVDDKQPYLEFFWVARAGIYGHGR
jgi:hypothetical protein